MAQLHSVITHLPLVPLLAGDLSCSLQPPAGAVVTAQSQHTAPLQCLQVLPPAVTGHMHQDALVFNLLWKFVSCICIAGDLAEAVYLGSKHGSCNCFVHAEPACFLWACMPVLM